MSEAQGMGRRDGAVADAKHPVTPLAGPYGHPFHPILVTVPIGAWIAALVFDIVSRVGEDGPVFAKGAYWLVGIGIVGALVAAVFGLLDLLAIPRGTRAFRTGLTHLVLNLVVVALFAIGFGFRHGNQNNADGTPIWLLVLAAVALAILGVSGWLGGKLTYRYGVRVVEDEHQADGYVPSTRSTGGAARPAGRPVAGRPGRGVPPPTPT